MLRLTAALLVTLTVMTISAVTTLAGTLHQVQVARSDQTFTQLVSCFKGGKSAQCSIAIRVIRGPHVELRADAGTALACTGTYYSYFDVYAWSPSNLSWNDTSHLDWRLEFNGQDWYNYCSAGTSWNNRAICQGWTGYYCNTYSEGHFWDGSRVANTDWLNQEISYEDFFGCNNYQDAMRVWTRVNGSWYWQNYWNWLSIRCGG
jgi:hypothetical protein